MSQDGTGGMAKYLPHLILLLFLCVLLYLPMCYIVLLSVSQNTIFPFPLKLTTQHYQALVVAGTTKRAFTNSLLLALAVGVLSTLLSGFGAWGVQRYRFRGRLFILVLFIVPIVVPTILSGLSLLMFWEMLEVKRTLITAILANTAHTAAFAFLIILVQFNAYPDKLDEIARSYGAGPITTFREITLPLVWPGLFGGFVVSFILAFNNFELTFFNLGATPTLPTLTWGTIRHGIEPEIYALSSLIILFTLGMLGLIAFASLRQWIRLGGRFE